MPCSIARTLAVAGEPWSPLVIRDVYVGITRFDDLQRDLGISRKVLAERLRHLVEAGLLERRAVRRAPAALRVRAHEMGSEFVDVLMAMVGWGDRWTAGDAGPPILYRHRACGQIARRAALRGLRCEPCTRPMSTSCPGPGLPASGRTE